MQTLIRLLLKEQSDQGLHCQVAILSVSFIRITALKSKTVSGTVTEINLSVPICLTFSSLRYLVCRMMTNELIRALYYIVITRFVRLYEIIHEL